MGGKKHYEIKGFKVLINYNEYKSKPRTSISDNSQLIKQGWVLATKLRKEMHTDKLNIHIDNRLNEKIGIDKKKESYFDKRKRPLEAVCYRLKKGYKPFLKSLIFAYDNGFLWDFYNSDYFTSQQNIFLHFLEEFVRGLCPSCSEWQILILLVEAQSSPIMGNWLAEWLKNKERNNEASINLHKALEDLNLDPLSEGRLILSSLVVSSFFVNYHDPLDNEEVKQAVLRQKKGDKEPEEVKQAKEIQKEVKQAVSRLLKVQQKINTKIEQKTNGGKSKK